MGRSRRFVTKKLGWSKVTFKSVREVLLRGRADVESSLYPYSTYSGPIACLPPLQVVQPMIYGRQRVAANGIQLYSLGYLLSL